jgi:hypothetical protein
MKLPLILGACTPLLFAQTNGPVSQRAGNCAVNLAGNNNTASLVCSGIDPKLAEQIKGILNGTLHNERAIQQLAKQLTAIQVELDRPSLEIQQHSEGANSPNTVNINQRPPPRRIPPERHSEIVGILAKFPAKIRISAIANDAEAFQFAQDWFDAFKEARWTMLDDSVRVFIVGGQPERGIMLSYHGETLPPGGTGLVRKDTPAGAILDSLIALQLIDGVHGQGSMKMAEDEFTFQFFEQPDK